MLVRDEDNLTNWRNVTESLVLGANAPGAGRNSAKLNSKTCPLGLEKMLDEAEQQSYLEKKNCFLSIASQV